MYESVLLNVAVGMSCTCECESGCCLCEAETVRPHHCPIASLGEEEVVCMWTCSSRVVHLCCDPARAYVSVAMCVKLRGRGPLGLCRKM